ncbi:hypothetical protein GMMP15_50019 [Candidatus Magnetomoraceae bacterium gMMP-15]
MSDLQILKKLEKEIGQKLKHIEIVEIPPFHKGDLERFSILVKKFPPP